MIDFSLSEEQQLIQKMARDFAQSEILPHAADFDRSGDYPEEIVRKAFQADLVYGVIPEQYGGGVLAPLISC